MGRLKLGVIVLGIGVVPVVTACGESGSVADSQIVSALKLEQSPGGPSYSIGGDPFCEVSDDLLNDSDEIEVATDGAGADLVITDSDESVGIQAVPPFDPACAKQARRELEQIE